MGGQTDRDLVVELSEIALSQVAPHEMAVFDETVAEYFRDPDAVLSPARRDEAVGFGLDAALATPFVLAVVVPVVHYLTQVVVDATKNEATSVVASLVRRLFRRPDTPAPKAGVPALTLEQGKRLRAIALERAKSLGLPDQQAVLLADSVTGAVLVTG
ncbi:MAG: hypothetical protein ABJA81_04050 [Nocardioidaceae bacterium]